MTTQKIIGNILKARKGAHMDKIIFKSKLYIKIKLNTIYDWLLDFWTFRTKNMTSGI